MNDLKSKIKAIVSEAVDLGVDEFGDDDHLYSDLGTDSVIGFEIITKIQKEFGLFIEDKEAPTLVTVNKIYESVKSKMNNE